MSFQKILIANRGEIAVRVARTCKRLGIASVAVYSFADRHALHTKLADEAYLIGPAESSESYLCLDAIIKAVKDSGANAVHPGYGFLSENAEFAKRLEDEGIVFIGPTPEVITLMGDKLAAKEAAKKANVPLIPGANLSGDNAVREAKKFIKENGVPALIKAAAGGGGRGMRKVYDEKNLEDQISGAAREAQSFFNNGDLFIEKLVENARHVEVQIIADGKEAIAFGDRDCSMQRNHQKVIEEAPAANISDKTRKKMHQLSEDLTKKAAYSGAGTVEFLLDADENLYFLEVNSRLQVEHPVTEEIFGVDLVELQIRVAEGIPLKKLIDKKALKPNGHAIELRICAENPTQNFAASTGKLLTFSSPLIEDIDVRFDTGFTTGDRVTHHYDSMLAKLIVHADSREAAISNTLSALSELRAAGVDTNVSFLRCLLEDQSFRDLNHHTQYAETLIPNEKELCEQQALLSALCLLWEASPLPLVKSNSAGWSIGKRSNVSRWLKTYGDFFKVTLEFCDESTAQVSVSNQGKDFSAEYSFLNIFSDEENIYLQHDDNDILFTVFNQNSDRWLHSNDGIFKLSFESPALKGDDAAVGGISNLISSPLPGKIVSVKAPVGTEVDEGTPIIVIESMKMEHVLTAPLAGTVEEIMVQDGDLIEANSILARLDFGL